MGSRMDHQWPTDQEIHKWGPWMAKTARDLSNPPTQYRKCIHPNCTATETRPHPAG